METANAVMVGVNVVFLSIMLWEQRKLRERWHAMVEAMSGMNLKAEMAILALKQAGLWKPEFDAALRKNGHG